MHVKHNIDVTYSQHKNLLNQDTLDAFKVGYINKVAYILRTNEKFNDILRQGDTAKARTRRASRVNAAHASADKKQGIKRT